MKYQNACTSSLTIRISPEEKQELEENAKLWHCSVSAYIRRLLAQDNASKTLAKDFLKALGEFSSDVVQSRGLEDGK